ncbi:hypothetical protein T03_4362 [Trichinella britovi]|uniref:Uncharacterized protein n=1 Tax=Trichinella britovi TaxID=45882 RepID=A0A0V1DK56_TRIBR|nr:hypothetical protein T03_4362 [Trichinella britovi]
MNTSYISCNKKYIHRFSFSFFALNKQHHLLTNDLNIAFLKKYNIRLDFKQEFSMVIKFYFNNQRCIETVIICEVFSEG